MIELVQECSRVTDQQRTIARSSIIRVTGLWFGVLAIWAFASPAGSVRDEAYHLASIYCGQGENPRLCPQRTRDEQSGLLFSEVPMNLSICGSPTGAPFVCPLSPNSKNWYITNNGLYPDYYYWTMSHLAVPNNHPMTIILIRLTNAALAALALATTLSLMARSSTKAHLLAMISTASPLVLFLSSSVNPRAWSLVGIGMAWPIIGGLVEELARINRSHKRIAAQVIALVASFSLAAMSRWDSAVMWVFVAAGGIILQARPRAFSLRVKSYFVIGAVFLISVPFWPVRFRQGVGLSSVSVEYRIGEGEVPALVHWLLHAIPKAAEVLGEGEITYPGLRIPALVSVIGITVVGGLLWWALAGRKILVTLFAIATVIFTGLILFTHSKTVDNLDPFDIIAQYVVMYLPAVVGLLLGSGTQFGNRPIPQSVVKLVTWPLIAAHALSLFTIVERFVDRQYFGLRVIPEGPLAWWWKWMPFGPNAWVAIGCVLFALLVLEIRNVPSGVVQESQHRNTPNLGVRM